MHSEWAEVWARKRAAPTNCGAIRQAKLIKTSHCEIFSLEISHDIVIINTVLSDIWDTSTLGGE